MSAKAFAGNVGGLLAWPVKRRHADDVESSTASAAVDVMSSTASSVDDVIYSPASSAEDVVNSTASIADDVMNNTASSADDVMSGAVSSAYAEAAAAGGSGALVSTSVERRGFKPGAALDSAALEALEGATTAKPSLPKASFSWKRLDSLSTDALGGSSPSGSLPGEHVERVSQSSSNAFPGGSTGGSTGDSTGDFSRGSTGGFSRGSTSAPTVVSKGGSTVVSTGAPTAVSTGRAPTGGCTGDCSRSATETASAAEVAGEPTRTAPPGPHSGSLALRIERAQQRCRSMRSDLGSLGARCDRLASQLDCVRVRLAGRVKTSTTAIIAVPQAIEESSVATSINTRTTMQRTVEEASVAVRVKTPIASPRAAEEVSECPSPSDNTPSNPRTALPLSVRSSTSANPPTNHRASQEVSERPSPNGKTISANPQPADAADFPVTNRSITETSNTSCPKTAEATVTKRACPQNLPPPKTKSPDMAGTPETTVTKHAFLENRPTPMTKSPAGTSETTVTKHAFLENRPTPMTKSPAGTPEITVTKRAFLENPPPPMTKYPAMIGTPETREVALSAVFGGPVTLMAAGDPSSWTVHALTMTYPDSFSIDSGADSPFSMPLAVFLSLRSSAMLHTPPSSHVSSSYTPSSSPVSSSNTPSSSHVSSSNTPGHVSSSDTPLSSHVFSSDIRSSNHVSSSNTPPSSNVSSSFSSETSRGSTDSCDGDLPLLLSPCATPDSSSSFSDCRPSVSLSEAKSSEEERDNVLLSFLDRDTVCSERSALTFPAVVARGDGVDVDETGRRLSPALPSLDSGSSRASTEEEDDEAHTSTPETGRDSLGDSETDCDWKDYYLDSSCGPTVLSPASAGQGLGGGYRPSDVVSTSSAAGTAHLDQVGDGVNNKTDNNNNVDDNDFNNNIIIHQFPKNESDHNNNNLCVEKDVSKKTETSSVDVQQISEAAIGKSPACVIKNEDEVQEKIEAVDLATNCSASQGMLQISVKKIRQNQVRANRRSSDPRPEHLSEGPPRSTTHLSEGPTRSTTHLSEGPSRSTPHLSEGPTRSTTHLSEGPMRSTTHLSEGPTRSTTHLSEGPTRSTTHLSEGPTRSTTHLSEGPMRSTTHLSEGPPRSTTHLSEGPTRSTTHLSEGPTRSTPLISERPTRSTTHLSEGPTRSTTHLSESPTRSTPLISERPSRSTTHLSEGPTRSTAHLSEGPTRPTPHLSEGPTRPTMQLSEGPTRSTTHLSEGPTRSTTHLSEGPTRSTPHLSEGLTRSTTHLSEGSTRSTTHLSVIHEEVSHKAKQRTQTEKQRRRRTESERKVQSYNILQTVSCNLNHLRNRKSPTENVTGVMPWNTLTNGSSSQNIENNHHCNQMASRAKNQSSRGGDGVSGKRITSTTKDNTTRTNRRSQDENKDTDGLERRTEPHTSGITRSKAARTQPRREKGGRVEKSGHVASMDSDNGRSPVTDAQLTSKNSSALSELTYNVPKTLRRLGLSCIPEDVSMEMAEECSTSAMQRSVPVAKTANGIGEKAVGKEVVPVTQGPESQLDKSTLVALRTEEVEGYTEDFSAGQTFSLESTTSTLKNPVSPGQHGEPSSAVSPDQHTEPSTVEVEMTPITIATDVEMTPITIATDVEMTPITIATDVEMTPITIATDVEMTPITIATDVEMTPITTATVLQHSTPLTEVAGTAFKRLSLKPETQEGALGIKPVIKSIETVPQTSTPLTAGTTSKRVSAYPEIPESITQGALGFKLVTKSKATVPQMSTLLTTGTTPLTAGSTSKRVISDFLEITQGAPGVKPVTESNPTSIPPLSSSHAEGRRDISAARRETPASRIEEEDKAAVDELARLSFKNNLDAQSTSTPIRIDRRHHVVVTSTPIGSGEVAVPRFALQCPNAAETLAANPLQININHVVTSTPIGSGEVAVPRFASRCPNAAETLAANPLQININHVVTSTPIGCGGGGNERKPLDGSVPQCPNAADVIVADVLQNASTSLCNNRKHHVVITSTPIGSGGGGNERQPLVGAVMSRFASQCPDAAETLVANAQSTSTPLRVNKKNHVVVTSTPIGSGGGENVERRPLGESAVPRFASQCPETLIADESSILDISDSRFFTVVEPMDVDGACDGGREGGLPSSARPTDEAVASARERAAKTYVVDGTRTISGSPAFFEAESEPSGPTLPRPRDKLKSNLLAAFQNSVDTPDFSQHPVPCRADVTTASRNGVEPASRTPSAFSWPRPLVTPTGYGEASEVSPSRRMDNGLEPASHSPITFSWPSSQFTPTASDVVATASSPPRHSETPQRSDDDAKTTCAADDAHPVHTTTTRQNPPVISEGAAAATSSVPRQNDDDDDDDAKTCAADDAYPVCITTRRNPPVISEGAAAATSSVPRQNDDDDAKTCAADDAYPVCITTRRNPPVISEGAVAATSSVPRQNDDDDAKTCAADDAHPVSITTRRNPPVLPEVSAAASSSEPRQNDDDDAKTTCATASDEPPPPPPPRPKSLLPTPPRRRSSISRPPPPLPLPPCPATAFLHPCAPLWCRQLWGEHGAQWRARHVLGCGHYGSADCSLHLLHHLLRPAKPRPNALAKDWRRLQILAFSAQGKTYNGPTTSAVF